MKAKLNSDETNKENEKSEDLLKRAVRPKQGIDERIFCMRLIQATFATDTKSIIANTCMAASMASIGYPKKLEKFDFEKFRNIKRIFGDIKDIKQSDYTKLRLPKRGPHDYSPPCGHIYPIPWSIEQSEEVYNSYIQPWVPQLVYFPEGIRKHRQTLTKIRHANEYYGWGWGLGKGCNEVLGTVSPEEAKDKMTEWIGKTCPHCKSKILEDIIIEDTGEYVINRPKWSFFWEASQYLAYEGFKKLRTAFEEWASDECGKAAMIMGKLVNENVYDSVLKQLRAKPEEEPD